jgi:hypothetical protein
LYELLADKGPLTLAELGDYVAWVDAAWSGSFLGGVDILIACYPNKIISGKVLFWSSVLIPFMARHFRFKLSLTCFPHITIVKLARFSAIQPLW